MQMSGRGFGAVMGPWAIALGLVGCSSAPEGQEAPARPVERVQPAVEVPQVEPAGGKCPMGYDQQAAAPPTHRDWWPNQLDLSVLHRNDPSANPMGPRFDYAWGFLGSYCSRRGSCEPVASNWPDDPEARRLQRNELPKPWTVTIEARRRF